MPRNISPGASEAIELRANALSDRIECALSGKLDRAGLNESSFRFLGELRAHCDMLHELMGCASFKVGTIQAHESIQRAEKDFWISNLRKLQESCKAYMDTVSDDGIAPSHSTDGRDLVRLADSISSDAELLIRLLGRF